MANTAALLGNLLNTNADINYYTQQQIYWNAKYEANSAKLSKQVNAEEKWESKFDDAINNTKEMTFYINGSKQTIKEGNTDEMKADAYAHAMVEQYNEELSLELADLDIEYDTMRTMYDTMLEELRAQQESEKTATSTAAQDTGLLQA